MFHLKCILFFQILSTMHWSPIKLHVERELKWRFVFAPTTYGGFIFCSGPPWCLHLIIIERWVISLLLISLRTDSDSAELLIKFIYDASLFNFENLPVLLNFFFYNFISVRHLLCILFRDVFHDSHLYTCRERSTLGF